MNTVEQEALQILTAKRDLLSQMLSVTERVKFTDSDEDSERFATLFEKRDGMMQDILKCDAALAEAPYNDLFENGSKDFLKETDKINNNMTAVASRLIELDKNIAEKSKDIMKRLKRGMKEVNEGKTMNSLYNDDLSFYEGYRFDQKN